MPNLMLTEYQVLALREFGAVTIGLIDGFMIGDEATVSVGNELRCEPYCVVVVDVTDATMWLVAVRA